MINFQSPSTVAAARAHVTSLRWQLAVWGLFAVASSFALGSFAAGFAWFLVVALATGFDAMLGHSYLTARGGKQQGASGALFAWGCAFSSIVFVAMPLILASEGGASGRTLGVLMAASAFVRVMVFLSRARGFMIVVGAPAAACLLAMPFVPGVAGPADALEGAIAVGAGVVGFLAYVVRASFNSDAMLLKLEAAHKHARDRQLEAEAKHAEAVEANRAKSEFLGVMTHELRTPLNAVIGFAEIIEEDLDAAGRGDLARDASRIEQSARHLLALIDQILTLTSVDAGQDALSLCDVDVRALLGESVAAFQQEARARGDRISLRIHDDVERAFTDAGKLMVCVSALLSNAVKFTSDGLIAVTAQRLYEGQEWLVIAVSDTGCGVAPADHERIFTPFTQLDGSTTRESGGMGLGLSVTQRFAQRLGGDVSVRSELSQGATFTLRLPLRYAGALSARAA